eukprot:7935865-Ditylum_brightwellii.AAC.1
MLPPLKRQKKRIQKKLQRIPTRLLRRRKKRRLKEIEALNDMEVKPMVNKEEVSQELYIGCTQKRANQ